MDLTKSFFMKFGYFIPIERLKTYIKHFVVSENELEGLKTSSGFVTEVCVRDSSGNPFGEERTKRLKRIARPKGTRPDKKNDFLQL